MLRLRGDETDPQVAVVDLEITRRAAALHRRGAEAEAAAQLLLDLCQRHVVILCALSACTDRHGLDEAQGQPLGQAEVDHRIGFVVIEAAHRNHVDLDRCEAGVARGFDAGHDPCQVATGELFERGGVQRVKTDVETCHPRRLEVVGEGSQARGVGA